jgi:hypothetical protein
MRTLLPILLICSHACAAEPYTAKVIRLVNEVRADADERELALHGSFILGPREPLDYDATLAKSAQWWCDACRGTGILSHNWTIDERGYLTNIPSGYRSSKVWLPTRAGHEGFTDYFARAYYLGLPDVFYTEVGLRSDNTSAESVVFQWTASGFHTDPRQASKHYAAIIHPWVTHAGCGKADKRVFMDLADFR